MAKANTCNFTWFLTISLFAGHDGSFIGCNSTSRLSTKILSLLRISESEFFRSKQGGDGFGTRFTRIGIFHYKWSSVSTGSSLSLKSIYSTARSPTSGHSDRHSYPSKTLVTFHFVPHREQTPSPSQILAS